MDQKHLQAGGRLLKEIRGTISQRALAQRCGFSPATVSFLETGKRKPQATTLLRILNMVEATLEQRTQVFGAFGLPEPPTGPVGSHSPITEFDLLPTVAREVWSVTRDPLETDSNDLRDRVARYLQHSTTKRWVYWTSIEGLRRIMFVLDQLRTTHGVSQDVLSRRVEVVCGPSELTIMSTALYFAPETAAVVGRVVCDVEGKRLFLTLSGYETREMERTLSEIYGKILSGRAAPRYQRVFPREHQEAT